MIALALSILLTQAADEAALTAALDKFKADYRNKEASARAAAVSELARTHHDKVYARLGQFLTVDEKEVRIAAAKGLSTIPEEARRKGVAYLVGSVPPNAKEPMVLAAILEALGKLKESPALAEVEKHLKSKQTPVAKAAVEAVGEIGARTSVPALIELLRLLEANSQEAPDLNGGGNTPGVGGGGTVDQDARDRERALKPIINKVLGELTKVRMNSWKEWSDWWRENGAKFRAGK